MTPALAAPLATGAAAAAAPAAGGAFEVLVTRLLSTVGPEATIKLLSSGGRDVGGDILQGLAIQGGATVSSSLQQALAKLGPSESQGVNPNSKYFVSESYPIEVQRESQKELFNREVLKRLGLLSPDLPPLLSPQEQLNTFVATREQQAESLAARERRMRELEGGIAVRQAQVQGDIDFRRSQMNRQFDQAIAGLQSGYSLEEQKQRQIGEVLGKKYIAEYGAAQNLLNSTIRDLMAPTPYANNPDLRQVATPI